MRRHPVFACLLLACTFAASAAEPAAIPAFPAPPKSEPVSETKFGITTSDPYRKLEDLKDPEVQAWMKAQAERTRTILDSIPGRKPLLADIDRLSKTATSRIQNGMLLKDGRLLLQRQEAGADSAKLLLVDGIDGRNERVLVDPEDWRKRTGKPHAINYFEPSPDGTKLAVGVSESGSEMATLHVYDLATMREVGKPVSRIWFGLSWLPDSSGMTYNRLNEVPEGEQAMQARLNSQAYLYVLGSDPEKAPSVFGNRQYPSLGITPNQIPLTIQSPTGDYVLGFPATVDNQVELFVAPRTQLASGKLQWKKLMDRDDQVRNFSLDGDDLYLLTTESADRRIERIRLPDGKREIVVDGVAGRSIDEVATRADALYYTLRDPSGVGVQLYRLARGAKAPVAIDLDGLNSLFMLGAQEGAAGLVVGGAGWTRFPAAYWVDAQGKTTLTNLQPQPVGVDASGIEASIVEVTSHDGAKIPLSIVRRKGLKLDGSHPTFLQGYGAYGISTRPGLIADHFAYFDNGFVRAHCHVRGGGDKGEAWYRGGFQATKSNTWKDFNACAKYLIDQKYTSPAKLGAMGTSAGGILVGNAMVEHPELYRVIFPDVGWTDALGSAQRDPNGPGNWPEFGDPNTEAGYKSLHAMSSYQKLKDGTAYPAVMALHGVQDPRVIVWNSSKFTSRVNEASTSGLPVLVRLDYDAGHGIGSTQSQENAERADIISFMLWQFGVSGFQPTLTASREAGTTK